VQRASRIQPKMGRKGWGLFFALEKTKGKGSDILEVQVLEGEVGLYDAGGLHPGAQHVLLGGDVVGTGYPLQVVQVAGEGAERRCGSWTAGHDPPESHGASPRRPRVPCPQPGTIQLGWAAPSWAAQQTPPAPRGHPAGRDGQPPGGQGDTQGRGIGGQRARTGGLAGEAAGAGGLPPFPQPFAQGETARGKYSLLWQPAAAPAETIDGAVPFIVKKHKGPASWEEAGRGRPEGWGAAWPGGCCPPRAPQGSTVLPGPARSRLPAAVEAQAPSSRRDRVRDAGGDQGGFRFLQLTLL